MKTGLSKIRKRGIAAAFSYMNIIEAWGSGIPKMFQEAKEYGLREPELIDMGSDFRINLYREKAITDQNGVVDPRERDTNDTKADTNDTKADTNDTKADTDDINDTYEKAILDIIQNDSSVTQKNIGKKLGISIATVKRIMRSLQKSGKLQREGSSRNGSWVIINSKE